MFCLSTRNITSDVLLKLLKNHFWSDFETKYLTDHSCMYGNCYGFLSEYFLNELLRYSSETNTALKHLTWLCNIVLLFYFLRHNHSNDAKVCEWIRYAKWFTKILDSIGNHSNDSKNCEWVWSRKKIKKFPLRVLSFNACVFLGSSLLLWCSYLRIY